MKGNSKYKLLALDLDGTLTDSKKEITEHTRITLLKAQAQGVRLILASGRPVFGIAPLAGTLQMAEYDGFILAYNGGQIIRCKTGEVLYEQMLDPEVLPYFYECSKRNGFEILTYDGDDVICENPDNEYVRYECFLNKMACRKVPDFLGAIHGLKPKCLIVGEPDRLACLEAEMAERLSETNGVYRSEAFFLELVPKGIDKARSLDALLAKLNLRPENLVACGDGYNDLSMIRYAGLGVAMANAKPEVRAAADYVTLSNEEDGVAAVVEKFILS